MRYFVLLMILSLAFPALAQTQNALQSKNDEPLEITADGTLEWHRNNKTFIARKNAMVKQGNISLAASSITANYRENAKNDMEIWQIIAENNVLIMSQGNTAHGQKAVYDLDRGLAVMTGDNLKLESPDQTVTAQDRFEYWITDGRLIAIGRAKVTRLKDTLEADKVSATFTENDKGERVLHSMEAVGNVVIKTPTEVLTGSYGIYQAATNVAELTGGVTIRRGPNILEGEKAQVDLNTNISRMFGDPKGDGRVRGIFYPGSEEKPQ